jgi:uncharacterized tellurite resistance protein B-like protein
MWNAFRSFFDDLNGGAKHPGRFEENDYRVAAAALLVHASVIDGQVSPGEHAKLRALLRSRFDLDDDAAQALIDEATDAENEAVDLYRFTSLLNRELDQAGREKIVEMMWQIVYADGEASELENNLLWRAADLLQVSSRDRVLLRQQVVDKRQGG